MKVLAFDISASPGAAVVDASNASRPRLQFADSIRTDVKNSDDRRYAYIEAFAVKIIHEQGPFDAVIREHFARGGSKRSTQLVFGSWAMIDAALGRYGYTVDGEVTPTEVKRLVGGDGRASKEEVAGGAKRLLRLGADYEFKSDDASDAAAVALAWLIREKVIKTKGETN